MDDQGFDFHKVPERRERKQFEPPPWERDAFEELQRQREAEQPVPQPAQPEPEPVAAPPAAVPPVAATPVQEARQPQTEAVRPPDAAEAPPQEASKQGPSEAEVLELLAGLAAEEPDATAPAMQVTVGASIVLLPIGAMMLFWGMAALARAASAQAGAGVARTGAVVLIMFGAGFVAAAFWLIYRLMKQRGVL